MIKPTILLILLMSVTGYIFCKTFHVTTLKFSKSSGYHTFLNSASFGGGLFIFSFIIFWLLTLWSNAGLWHLSITSILIHAVNDVLPNMYVPLFYIHIIQISIIALLFALLLPKFLIWYAAWLSGKSESLIRRYTYKKIANTDDSPEFTSITFKSWETGLPVAFTMSNRKVYIGVIIEGANHINDIIVLPLKSGYRCKDEQRLELVTHYQPVFTELKEARVKLESKQKAENEAYPKPKSGPKKESKNTPNKDLEKFYITLPIREIIHANLHDFKRRDLFQKHETPKKTTGIRDKIQALKNPH